MRRHKFNAQATVVDGIAFDSKAEAKRYSQLKLLLLAGEISSLELQPTFELQPGFNDNTGKRQRAIKYQADFRYVEGGQTVIEEVKGYETPLWKVKEKMFLYRYPQYKLRIIKSKDIR